MRSELKKYLINKYDGSLEGQDYPCGNQVVGKYIWVSKIDDYVLSFLNNIKADVIQTYQNKPYKVKINNELYQIVIADRENNKGKRTYKGYIDGRIEDEIIEFKVLPSMTLYCKEVKVF